MGTKALRLFAVRGIDIRVDASWLIIAALVTWSFWGRFTTLYDRAGQVALGMAVVAAVLFFASVLLHELAHSLEAKRRGVYVSGITLFLFGGVTETSFDVKRPRDEFALTAVGPLTSFALGAGMGTLAMTTADSMSMVSEVAGLIAWINIALGAFNLIPGAPLDGGRILRSIVWSVTGDRRRAMVVAASAGRFLGMGLIAFGAAQLLFVRGGFAGGAWLALIGWFLMRAAGAEQTQAELSEALEDVPVRELLSRAEPADVNEPVTDVVRRWQRSDLPDTLPVDDADRLVGAVRVDDLRRAERATTVRDAMASVDDLPSIEADGDAASLLESFDRRGTVVAEEAGRPAGIVTSERFFDAARRARTRRASKTTPA